MRADRVIRRLGPAVAAGLAFFWGTDVQGRGAAFAPVAAFGAQDAPDPAPQTVTLEFDVPPQVETRGNNKFELRGVEIGVFSPARPLQLVSVGRSQWQIRGNKAQVSFQLAAVPRGSNPVTVRLRFLSDGPAGEWSAVAGEIRAPETAVVEAPRQAPRPPKGVAPGALDQRSALKQATIDLLGPNQSLDTALSAFSNVRTLALAVVVSRTHKLNFVDLCAAIKGPPTLGLPAALLKLNPKIDAAAVTRNARKEARTLAARDAQAAPATKKLR